MKKTIVKPSKLNKRDKLIKAELCLIKSKMSIEIIIDISAIQHWLQKR